MFRSFLIAATLMVAATAASAQTWSVGSIQIEQAWTRATAPSAKAGGGFLSITNKGSVPDRLVSARSTASSKVEIHEMKMDGNVMRMRELEKGLDIPAGATVMLKPGGYHIMFMELTAPFAKDDKVPVTLVFEKAGSVDIVLKVEATGAGAPAGGHKH